MERNADKPRFWREDSSAEAFAGAAQGENAASDHRKYTAASLAQMSPAEQAGILMSDRKTAEELKNSLEGRKEPK